MKTYPMRARIRNEGTGPARVDIFDDIGAGGWFSEGYTPASFADAIRGVSGPLDVHINSGGGDVADGIAIASAIRAYPGPKRTVVDGMAASIASVIAQAGDERIVEPGAMLMIHDPLTACMGNQDDFLKVAETLGKHGDNLAQQYADRSGTKSAAEWRDVMRQEEWYTADEAVAAGLADRVGTAEARLPQGLDVDALAAHAPARIMARLMSMPRAAAEPEPYDGDDPCPTCKGKKTIRGGNMACPDCKGTGKAPAGDAEDRAAGLRAAAGDPCKTCGGKKRLPHPGTGKASMKCPGCDGTGAYDPDTAPDEGDPDGEPGGTGGDGPAVDDRTWELIRAALRGVRADGKVDNSPWDGAQAMGNGTGASDPAAFYAGICAGEKAGDKSTQAAWALPFKYHPDDPPNAAGVKAALGRLPQAEGLTNEAEAKKTLQAAMRVVNPDWEPDDSTSKANSGLDLEKFRAAMPALRGVRA